MPAWRTYAIALFFCVALVLLWSPASLARSRLSARALLTPAPPLRSSSSSSSSSSAPPPLLPHYECTASERALQLQRLVIAESACPSGDVWPRLLAAGLACQPLTLLNVGANKGYAAAALLAALRPLLGVTPRALHEQLVTLAPSDVEDVEGLCNDAFEGAAAAPALAPPCAQLQEQGALALHLFEPLPGNAELLRQVLLPFAAAAAVWAGNASAPLPVALHLHELAMVGKEGLDSVQFGACAPGNERCGVGSNGSSSSSSSSDSSSGEDVLSRGNVVRAATLDAWLASSEAEAAGLPAAEALTVDVLQVDAEGLDPEVLLGGAQALLARQGVRLLLFEYHSLRAWRSTSLEHVVGALSALNYDCFFLLQHAAVLRITGCWDPGMEFRQWANVLCVRRGEAGMLAALNAMTPMVSGVLRSPGKGAVSVAQAGELRSAAAAEQLQRVKKRKKKHGTVEGA